MKKNDRTLFFTGLAGVIAVIALIFYLPCPSVTQEKYLSIALGLMAALVASQIPGILNIDMMAAGESKIKAGGAVAVFVLVVFVDPASVNATEAEMRFSNISCQGKVPIGKELDKSLLPDSLDPAKEGTIKGEESLGRPVRFEFFYPHGEYSGKRYWSQVKEGVWIETYPNGELFTAFREVDRTIYQGCEGIIVERQDGSKFKIFIPDRGCGVMAVWWQSDASQWFYLGNMESVV